MRIQGACHCGAIRFEAQIDPDTVSVCHCGDCQTLSGAPFRASVPAKAENFTFLQGAVKPYVKVADSGNRRRTGFCSDCGTQIYSTDDVAAPAAYMLRVGTIAERDLLVPKKQIWCQSAQPWAQDITGLEGYAQAAPAKK
jgi:hypothetical protein